MSSYPLGSVFQYNSAVPSSTVDAPISLEAASFCEFFFARVDIPDGGDCSFTLEFPEFPLGTYPTYNSGTTYGAGAIVDYLGIIYASLAGSNIGHQPDTDAGAHWLSLVIVTTKVVIPCNGGEILLDKTKILSVSVSSVSGCNVQVIGGSR
jgi:hypothetical protein